jgi:hypothetical protein
VKRFLIAALLGAASLSACGGGTSSPAIAPATLAPSAAPSAQPSATPAPAAPQSSLASIDFSTNAATTLTVTESSYTATFRETDTCNPLTGQIAAVSAVPAPPPGSASYSVTPMGMGSCQITVSDAAGKSVSIPVTVSSALITVQ